MAHLMTADHPQSVLEDALGTDAATVMPELGRLADLRVRLPRYALVMPRRARLRRAECAPESAPEEEVKTLSTKHSTG